MAEKTIIPAAVRTEFGKGAARRTRREGQVPVVLYGHGTDPQHLSLPAHATFLALRGNSNALLTLDIEGTEQLALTKDIQLDPVKRSIEHVDLMIIRKGERVTVEVPVHTVGESYPGTIHTVEKQTVSLTVDATAIPEFLQVDISDLEDGAIIRVNDVQFPEGSTLEDDPEQTVVLITVPRVSDEDLETPAEDTEAPAAAAEASADDQE